MILCRKIIYFPLPPIKIDNNPIPYNHSVKFLGLIIDSKLKWQNHINFVRAKLSSACGIMFQIRNRISVSIAKIIYYTIAYPYMNYCSNVWSSAHVTYFQSLLTTQRKLIRLILKKGRRTETTVLFKQLKLLKFQDLLKVNALLFVYKSVHNLIHSPFHFQERYVQAYNLRVRHLLQLPNHTSNQSERFIYIRGIRLWNEIPENIKNSQSIFTFKRKLKKYYIDMYN